jgi:hypothetical protein
MPATWGVVTTVVTAGALASFSFAVFLGAGDPSPAEVVTASSETTGPAGPQGETGPAGPQGESGVSSVETNPTMTLSTANGDFAYTGSPIFTTVVAIGTIRVVQIVGDFSTVTAFGTGQLYFTLPFSCSAEYDGAVGHIHDGSKVNRYLIFGECEEGSSRMELFYMNTRSQIEVLTPTSLMTLDTQDSFTLNATLVVE